MSYVFMRGGNVTRSVAGLATPVVRAATPRLGSALRLRWRERTARSLVDRGGGGKHGPQALEGSAGDRGATFCSRRRRRRGGPRTGSGRRGDRGRRPGSPARRVARARGPQRANRRLAAGGAPP